ncbi:hypothetical protein BDN70DRAFT_846519 [Pholiota conissans]|uniref:Lethal giant larvae (Lgl)-like C-terminal domain-containing protein n=1 Tax=Pholiota conissans TaxID=109636 RepID=A0A9P5ZGA3_9AGAR|nr:hypothetical protein BDN70DRAFT_846519 [Pholiota conissans]
MFSKQAPELALPDLSTDLQDEHDWKVGSLKIFDIPLNVATIAIEPISRLLAVGTSEGTVHIFGRPGVECKIKLPQPSQVRFLQFAISTYNLVCLDGENQMHVYNLLEFGKPKYVTSARFDTINSITVSPSHTHIFLATQHGDIKTYDLGCLRKSQYFMPNLWKLYEEKMAASGVPTLTPPDPLAVEAVDVVIHPRNLDLLFVAYAGGIILTDLTERSTIRAYELLLQPGTPGGAGYYAADLLSHRRSMVTSVAVHPSGHFFAAGYADGSVAFWAVDDDNKPLLVRTLYDLDVNILDPDKFDSRLANQNTTSTHASPEPIFKLSWSGFPSSDPRGGDTILTILGGLTADKPPGLTAFLLPPFNPPEAPADPPAPANTVHPFYRNAMCQSLVPKKTFFYETRGLVQDYLLLPHTTPHFAGNFDPYAILLIIEVDATRTVEAYQYPPGFIEVVQAPTNDEISTENSNPLSSGLLSPPPPAPLPKSPRHMNYTPVTLRTPFPLLSGNAGIIGGQLLSLEKDVYQGFITNNISSDRSLNLKGGCAYAETTSEMKLLKYQPHRLLVTYNQDLSVRFFDFSSQLLLSNPTSNSLLENDWPEALPKFTISLAEVFDDSRIADLLITPIHKTSIQSVDVAQEAQECAIALTSGEVLVYHPRESRSSPSSPNISSDAQIVMLDHVYSPPGSDMVPFFMLTSEKGPVETFALSDIGFLAVSYQNGALVILDMRGPRIMYASEKAKKGRHSVIILPQVHLPVAGGSINPISLGHDSGVDIIRSLTWTVGSLEKDPRLSVRLIAVHQSGDAELYTLAYSGSPKAWNIAGEPAAIKAVVDPIANGTFVLDKKTGAPWKADRGRFAGSFQNVVSFDLSGRPVQPQCILVSVGAKGARSYLNITGERISKVEWGNKVGNVQTAHIIEHMGSRALVVQTDRRDGLIYSLPYLEYICTVHIPVITTIPVTIDNTGDFIAFVPYAKSKSNAPIQSLIYGTLFNTRRFCLPPDIDFASTQGTVPPQPQPVSPGPASLLGSWFSYRQTLSGDQIDELLGGPDRPIIPKNSSTLERETSAGQESAAGSTAASIAAGAAAVQSSIYNRLTSAMSERGQILGDLEERFNSLEEGSRNMVAQAKKMAAQQTAKSWFGF